MFCINSIYEAGGIGSLVVDSAGLFRKVTKPTTIGMRINIRDRNSNTNPTIGDRVPVLLTPFTSVEYGMLPVAVSAPNRQRNNPGQPQSNTDAIVAMMPVFLLFISCSPVEPFLSVYR